MNKMTYLAVYKIKRAKSRPIIDNKCNNAHLNASLATAAAK